MDSITSLRQWDVLTNQELCDLFKCSPQGGMRRGTATNTLVIVTNHVKSIYDDKWEDDVIHYTGMGQIGNQELTFHQNRTLHESPENGVAVHLFEVFREKEYTYIGEVVRAAEPYQATQPDAEGNERQVWLFPLRLKSGEAPVVDAQESREAYDKQAKRAAGLSDDELLKRAKNAPRQPGARPSIATQYSRSAYVAEHAKRRAEGICDLCEQPSPFHSKKGAPYLECHHIVWLAKGGEDTIENTVALCPNCHRKMHVLNLHADVEHLKAKVSS